MTPPERPRKGQISSIGYGSRRRLGQAENVRFTPESGHLGAVQQCPLSAKSGHSPTTVNPGSPANGGLLLNCRILGSQKHIDNYIVKLYVDNLLVNMGYRHGIS